MNINFYEFWSMKRSGQHAIFEWMFYNIIGNQKRIYINRHSFYSDGFLYMNDGEYHCIRQGMMYKPKIVFISYEEKPVNYSIINVRNTQKFVIVRSLENLVASRIKKQQEPNEIYDHKSMFAVDQTFFDVWENHASSNINHIYFDKWITDVDYRNTLSLKFKFQNKDNLDTIPEQGGGSSFSGMRIDSKETLLNRHKQVDINSELMYKINKIKSQYPEFQ